tara:strand:+ start:2931 stop:3494 length:564 start_codon:yes stop_codon:yes gene_type:complete
MIQIRHILTLGFIALCTQLCAGNFVIDSSHSVLAVDVRASPPHSFICSAKEFEVDIQINPQTLDLQAATCSFSFESLDSEKPKRDKNMRDWINTTHYPKAQFELTNVRQNEIDGTLVGVGQFSMHGVSREIEVPFTIRREGKKIILDGQAELDTTQWDLEIIRIFFFSVKPIIQPHFHLQGTLTNDA